MMFPVLTAMESKVLLGMAVFGLLVPNGFVQSWR